MTAHDTYHKLPGFIVISLLDYNKLIGNEHHVVLTLLCPAAPNTGYYQKISVGRVKKAFKGPDQSNRLLDPN